MKYAIFGGGWAGLLCAHEIKKSDKAAEIEIPESSEPEKLGGLLRFETVDGFTYDVGGPPILFSKNNETLFSNLENLGDNQKNMERKNFIHFEGRLNPYPFENGIYQLPSKDRAKIGFGNVENLMKMKSQEEWKHNK